MNELLKPLFGKLSVFAKKRMGFSHPPKLFLKQDAENSNMALGKTAYYDPENESVTIYVSKRHPKDILRSFAHELVHHTQKLRGEFDHGVTTDSGYAQKNTHMRNMEKEAYLQGNMCFRDWEDTLDNKDIYTIKIAESKFLKENKTMTTKITKKFLKETIEKVLKEYGDDLDATAVASVNTDLVAAAKAAMSNLDRIMPPMESIKATIQSLIGMDTEEADQTAKEYIAKVYPKIRNTQDRLDLSDFGEVADAQIAARIQPEPEEEESKWVRGLKAAADSGGVTGHSAPVKDRSGLTKEGTLYEQRFGSRNSKLFEKLKKEWTK